MKPEPSILLFDGVCHLCQGSVKFVLKRDRHERFRFAALQSPAGQKLLREYGLDPKVLNSLVLIEGGQSYQRSAGVLRLLKGLGGLWSLLYVFILVPRPLRDAAYDLLARNRYRWFGRDESCLMPTADIRRRFL